MFSLIITIISVALVAALALATLYYGGNAFSRGHADAKASQILSQGQQLIAAADLYRANHGVFPPNKQALLDGGYLKAIPVAQNSAVSVALAEDEEWVMPKPGVPVFVLPDTAAAPCQRVNYRSYRMDGILPKVNESIAAQCYGAATSDLKTVVAKSGSYLRDAFDDSAMPADDIEPEGTSIPDASDTGAWTVPPGETVADSGGSGGPVDAGPPFGWCGSGDEGMYPCPDPDAPTQPAYCVAGVTLGDETACQSYLPTWVPETTTAMFVRTRYTVTIHNDGTFSGIPHSYGHVLSVHHATESDPWDGLSVGSSQPFNPVLQTLNPVAYGSNNLSDFTSGYFTLNNIYGAVWAPSASEWDNGTHVYGGWETQTGAYGAHDTYPLYSPGNGNYTNVPTVVRWAATGQSSLTLCIEFDANENPALITGPYTFGIRPTITGLSAGSCNP